MALKIINREVNGVDVITLDGRLVYGEETYAVRDQVKTILAAGRKKIVLDLGKVTFVDSTGLGVLVGVRQTTKTANAQLRLCDVDQRFADLLKMTQLWPLFDVSSTEAEAISALSK